MQNIPGLKPNRNKSFITRSFQCTSVNVTTKSGLTTGKASLGKPFWIVFASHQSPWWFPLWRHVLPSERIHKRKPREERELKTFLQYRSCLAMRRPRGMSLLPLGSRIPGLFSVDWQIRDFRLETELFFFLMVIIWPTSKMRSVSSQRTWLRVKLDGGSRSLVFSKQAQF